MNTKNTEVEANIITTTKEIVDGLLACNISNRNPRQRVVNQYRRDIENGNWHLTHQGIALSANDVLIDGQHRLLAIKEAGYPAVKILLVSGLNHDVQKYVDQQAKRTMKDVLKVVFDRQFTVQAPAIARNIVAIEKNLSTRSTSLTPDELISKVDEYYEEIVAATTVEDINKDYFAAAYLSGFVYLMKSNPDQVNNIIKFMQSVFQGEMLTKEMPAYHLRNYIATHRNIGGGNRQISRRIEAAMKSTQFYLDNKEMKLLRLTNS